MVSASMLLGQLEPLHWEDAKGVGLISSCERSSPLLEFWAHQRARIDERREELLHLRGNVDATDGHADDHAEKEWDELRSQTSRFVARALLAEQEIKILIEESARLDEEISKVVASLALPESGTL
mmetsp:Transcript_15932/g.32030  ORF Transcript_15932/g.32030 Transcript_15932/m.32030 type:complete len:125 (+) Transcript_15932:237-611(+)